MQKRMIISMKKTTYGMASLLLSACASMQGPDPSTMPSADICFSLTAHTLFNERSASLWDELSRRGEECGKFREMTAARIDAQNQSNANMNAAISNYQKLKQPPPVQQRRQTVCETRNFNGVLRTICN